MYHPMAPGQIHPVSLALRAGPIPASAADRLREITTALAPTLRVDELNSLYDLYRQLQRPVNFAAYLLATVTLSVLLLSAAGLYALMSFTVNQRRREIGIHSALGGTTAAPTGGHLQMGAGPGRGRDCRRRPGGAPPRLLHAGRAGPKRPSCHPRSGSAHDGDRPARGGRPGPSRSSG